MIRAAVDARTAYPALVIVDDATAPPRLVLARSIGLAEYEDLPPEKRRGYFTKRRLPVTVERIASRVDAIVALLVEQRGERLAIEAPGRAEFSGRFVDALRDAATAAGVEVERVRTAWPLSTEPERPETVRDAIDGWPSESPPYDLPNGWRAGDFKGVRDAGRVLLHDMGAPSLADELGASVAAVDAGASVDGSPPLREREAPPEHDEDGGPDEHDTDADRILAIDTGGNVGVIVAEETAADVATRAPLFRVVARPRMTVDPLDAGSRAAFLLAVAALIRDHRVKRVAIERVSSVHAGHAKHARPEDAIARVRGQATGLVQSNWLGGMVEGMIVVLAAVAKSSGEPAVNVDTAPAATWRAKVAGKAHAKDSDVTPIVRARFLNWPDRSTADQRDAAGIILWSAEKAKPRAARVRAPGTSRSSAWNAKRAEERAAKRAATGCTCGPSRRGRHAKGCPLNAPRAAQLCRVCRQPRKGHTCTGATPPKEHHGQET